MATITFQRGPWCLQIARTARTFAVSFSTTSSRRSRPTRSNLPAPSSPLQEPLRTSRHDAARRTPRHADARRAFTTTRVFREQQAQAQQATANPSGTATNPLPDLTAGFTDKPIELDEGARQVDWQRSFHGLSAEAFSKEAQEALLAPLDADDIEVKPDGIVYLPEIKYRRILNSAFKPGGWGLAPRGETIVTQKAVTREYALVALGRLVSIARGEQDYFSPEGIPTAAEGCKSNALMRCCKDLGVASELWDPRFIRKFIKENAREAWVEHQVTKKKKKIWIRKDDAIGYPFKETKGFS